LFSKSRYIFAAVLRLHFVSMFPTVTIHKLHMFIIDTFSASYCLLSGYCC